MIDLLRPLRALAAMLRRIGAQREGRRLLAENPQRGLLPEPFALALHAPEVLERPGELRALLTFAQLVRGKEAPLLARLSALPAPLADLSALRPTRVPVQLVRPFAVRAPFALPPPFSTRPRLSPRRLASRTLLDVRVRMPAQLSVGPPLESRVRELGQARPRALRLDDELRVPVEIEPLRVPSDAQAIARQKRVRPRTPIARAPLPSLRPRNFRLDRRSLEPLAEELLPPERQPIDWGWLSPALRREKVDLQWMAREHVMFLGPSPVEWFTMWWFENTEEQIGGRESRDYELPQELGWALEAVKEQMLIRRDVKKDETLIEPGEYSMEQVGMSMAQMENEPISALIPETQWVSPWKMPGQDLPFEARVREVYLQWRTLIGALEER